MSENHNHVFLDGLENKLSQKLQALANIMRHGKYFSLVLKN